jgi:hypothetical protein
MKKVRKMIFRKACEKDIDTITEIYEDVHSEEEAGRVVIGWIQMRKTKLRELCIKDSDMKRELLFPVCLMGYRMWV